jgi:acetate kinase
MKILVINAGSSSLKYQLLDMDSNKLLAKGNCECIGTGGIVTHKKTGATPYRAEPDFPTHEEALAEVLRLLTDAELGVIADVSEIDAVGHRVVHGGKYKESTLIDDEVISYLESIVPINPLHGPAAIIGMRGCIKLMPGKPQVAVFDTAFHATMEPESFLYPIPYEMYEKYSIRRYGFHGTSHRYVSKRAAELAGKPMEELKIVTCHLGNGSSIAAEMNGKVIDTSMGFTPLAGIPMGTRCGDIDPSVVTYMLNNLGMTGKEVDDLMNRKSGLLGVSGLSNDFRTVVAAAKEGHERALLAFNLLKHGIKKTIGSYVAEMNGIDVLVFTAGIGENQQDIRAAVCRDMDYLGIKMDEEKNMAVQGYEACVSAADSKVQIWIIPTEEELMIAKDTAALAAAN